MHTVGGMRTEPANCLVIDGQMRAGPFQLSFGALGRQPQKFEKRDGARTLSADCQGVPIRTGNVADQRRAPLTGFGRPLIVTD